MGDPLVQFMQVTLDQSLVRFNRLVIFLRVCCMLFSLLVKTSPLKNLVKKITNGQSFRLSLYLLSQWCKRQCWLCHWCTSGRRLYLRLSLGLWSCIIFLMLLLMLVLICFWWVIFFVMSLRIEIFLRFILNRGIVQLFENISIGLLSSRSRRRSHFMSFLRLNRSLRLLILLLIPILVLLIVFSIFLAIISIVVVWRLFIPVTLILLLLIIFTTELIILIFLVFRSILILICE